jgi:hypothetical protein
MRLYWKPTRPFDVTEFFSISGMSIVLKVHYFVQEGKFNGSTSVNIKKPHPAY